MEQKPRPAAIYTRISEDPEDNKRGVDSQFEDCEKLAIRQGLTVVATFSDDDMSAYSGKRRPDFEALLMGIKNGDFSAVVVWHVDRLYRSMKDLERLITIAEAAAVQIVTVNSGDLDLSTSAGRMVARILGSVTRQESEHHAERRRAANEKRRVKGKWCATGNRTFGYTTAKIPNPEDEDKKILVGKIVEKEAQLLRDAASAIIADNKSLHAIARDWNAAGHTTTKGVPWTNLHVRRVITNPRIAGIVVHQGKPVTGVVGEWPAILDVDDFHGLVAYLNKPSRRNGLSFVRKYQGSGIYRCDVCKQPLYASYPHGKDKPMFYSCMPHSHVARCAQPLDDFVSNAVLTWMEEGQVRPRGKALDVKGLKVQRQALEGTKDELSQLLADGLLNASAVREQAERIKGKIDILTRQIEGVTRTSRAARLAADDNIRETWDKMTDAERGLIIAEVSVVTIKRAVKRTRGGFDPSLVDVVFPDDNISTTVKPLEA